VHYARSANAIDENRKDFQRVAWGGSRKVRKFAKAPNRLIQLWFAGNHSDIGGSYAEAESRLSDNALWWMIEQATTRLAKVRHDKLLRMVVCFAPLLGTIRGDPERKSRSLIRTSPRRRSQAATAARRGRAPWLS
jgi:hypothetical protein